MTISIRLSDGDAAIFRKYAEMNRQSVSEMIRSTVLEKIEDEYDLRIYQEAFEAFERDSRTFSLKQVEKELGVT